VNHPNRDAEMVITGPWTSRNAKAVASGKVDRLVLNYALGFEEPSLDFLDGLPLREVVVLAPHIVDLQPVYSLAPTLRALHVTTSPQLRLDLERLPKLEELAAAWAQVSDSISSARGLKLAHLRSYQPTDLTPLEGLIELRTLVMKDRPKVQSLRGLRNLTALTTLGVYLAKDLADIGELEGRDDLVDLALEHCRRVTHLDVLSACTSLRSLNLSECGEIASLGPIRGLTQLERVLMYGSTKIADADLSPLAELPRLRELRMQSRRSYQPSVEEVQAQLFKGK